MTTTATSINLILADDHEIFRDGVSAMINKVPEINLVAEAANGEELVKLAKKFKPDVIITDIKMPVMNGIEATKLLKAEMPDIGIIALSMFNEEDLIVDMLEAGANGYLLKNAHRDEIVAAVQDVFKGEPYYCRDTTNKLAHMIANSKFNPNKKIEKPVFSANELAIIKMICEENSNKEMAEQLKLSKRTIESYREKILDKIDAKNTAGVVVYALKHRLYTYQT
jgi:DNA-binding NarL/FixJ family response regulator